MQGDLATGGLVARGREPDGIRRFPHPFRAMLAVSTDIDLTTVAKFRETHRFLNTREETVAGPGVGLDIANSFWMYNPSPLMFRYFKGYDWASRSGSADELLHYLRCGWIDTIHSYGNFTDEISATREHAVQALAALEAENVHVSTWTDHGTTANLHNFGVSGYEGDLPGSGAYHTDLLCRYGVKFAWNHTQRPSGVGTEYPLSPMLLKDGKRIWGFPRATRMLRRDADAIGKEEGVRHGQTGAGQQFCMSWFPNLLQYQLEQSALDALVERGGYHIVGQHLGVTTKRWNVRRAGPAPWFFEPDAVEAFQRLRENMDRGRILVARTSRLLEYARMWRHVGFRVKADDGATTIEILGVDDPLLGWVLPDLDQCRGLTFYVERSEQAKIMLGDDVVPEEEIVRNPADERGPSIGIAWFKPDLTDYTLERPRTIADEV